MIVGNDISQFQGKIDWDTYKNNSNFVIIRATYGVGYFDGWFGFNRSEARRVGLPLGFYHYAYPQYNTPEAEADWFLKACWDIKEGELLVLDFEERYTGDIVDWCKRFLDHIQQNLNGYKPLIYLNQSQTSGYDWKPVVDAGYGLWLASYNEDGTGSTGDWPFMAMQQTSSSQQVPGIVGNVDRDIFFGDQEAFGKYGYQLPIQEPITQPEIVPTPTTSENITTDMTSPNVGSSVIVNTGTQQVQVPITQSGTEIPPVQTNPLPETKPTKPPMDFVSTIVWILLNIKRILWG